MAERRRLNAIYQLRRKPNKHASTRALPGAGALCGQAVVACYRSLCSKKIFEISKIIGPRPLSEVRITQFWSQFSFQKTLEFRKFAKMDNAVALMPGLSLRMKVEFDTIRPTSGTTPRGVWQPTKGRGKVLELGDRFSHSMCGESNSLNKFLHG
jgi:hypothetical protein